MLTGEQKGWLKQLALASIKHGLETGKPISPDEFAQQEGVAVLIPDTQAAAFVTLKKEGALRGCIGSLNAYRPLAEDIAENAFAAAFRDPRFSPVTDSELTSINLSISVLTAAELMKYTSEADLISQIRPGIDGLILTEGGNRGTFLPSVWQELPQTDAFLMQLKLKAGLPADYWSGTIKLERYETISW